MTTEQFDLFNLVVKESGLTRSLFFRDCILNNKTQIIAKKKPSADFKTILFIMNKTSNNINQIAKKLNTAEKSNLINNAIYINALNQLISVNEQLQGMINDSQN